MIREKRANTTLKSADTPQARLPNLFLVGAQKSGTTALAFMLRQHPRVFICSPKEPGFLAFGEAGYRYFDGCGRLGRPAKWVVRSKAAYLRLFADAGAEQSVLGEGSTWYFAIPGMARRLKAFNPEARVIVSLRHPVDRAYSAWCHARRSGAEPCEQFSEALAREGERGETDFILRYRYMSRYCGPLRDYQAYFGSDRLLVILYDDLQNDPAQVWHRICRFLDIAEVAEPPRRRYNQSGMPRFNAMDKLLQSAAVHTAARQLLPRRLRSFLGAWFNALNLQSFPPLDADLRAALTREFREEIQELGRLTGRDLGHWLVD